MDEDNVITREDWWIDERYAEFEASDAYLKTVVKG